MKMTKGKSLSINRRLYACINAVKICINENHMYQASALTLSTLLAIVPMITVSLYVAAYLPVFDKVITDLKNYIFANFLPSVSDNMDQYLLQFVDHAVKLPIGGMLFLFLTVVMLVMLVKNAINDIWHSQKHVKWTGVLISWLALFCMPLLVGVSIFSSYYLLSLSWVNFTIDHLGIDFILSTLIPVLINILAFSMLYYFSPNCHVRVSDSLFGGLVAAVLFEVAKRIFEFYIRYFANYDLIYGSIAIIPTFMIWVYICWSIVIYGAIVAYAQNQQRIL